MMNDEGLLSVLILELPWLLLSERETQLLPFLVVPMYFVDASEFGFRFLRGRLFL